jgi:IS5 family transposase
LDPELALIDTILDKHPEIHELVKADLVELNKDSVMGRQDSPSVEQIVRAAIFKEMKGLDYRGLEYAQKDSRICEIFIKLEQRQPFSFEVLQKYISKIKPETLKKVLVLVNRVGLEEGIEDLEKLRIDSTVVESNIHYPTNNSLIWDCIRESERLLSKLKEIGEDEETIDYTKQAKSNHFQINVIKGEEKRRALFEKQLKILKRSIKQTEAVFKKLTEKKKGKKVETGRKMEKVREALGKLLPLMKQVYEMSEKREIRGEQVPNKEKLYSIYETHTDIIVKGAREVEFGHKVNLSGGKSNLVLWCEVVDGNPADTTLYENTLKEIKLQYGVTPRDVVTDGGYASLNNL